MHRLRCSGLFRNDVFIWEENGFLCYYVSVNANYGTFVLVQE